MESPLPSTPTLSTDLSPELPSTPPPSRGSHLLREIVETALLTAIVFLLVNAATGRFQIDGSSMEPNLHHDERVIVDKISYLLGAPQRGDVVVFYLDGQPKDYIKRVIGLPGETIEIANGIIYINGQLLDEPYILQSAAGALSARQLSSDEYFVMGDNRGNSQDSRSFGAVHLKNIVGRAWIIYWPPADWAIVPHHTYAAAGSS